MKENFVFDSLVSDEFKIDTAIEKSICKYAYNKKATLHEISIALHMPEIYIEGTLKELISKRAVIYDGQFYTTNFIILRYDEIKKLRKLLCFKVSDFADYFRKTFNEYDNRIKFYGSNFGMKRLGYFVCPNVIREIISNIPKIKTDKQSAPIEEWGRYIGTEADDDTPMLVSGCNVLKTSNGERLQYFWLESYFEYDTVYIGGMKKILDLDIINKAHDGVIDRKFIDDDDAVNLIIANMIKPTREKDGYILNFPCFDKKSFNDFMEKFYIKDESFREVSKEQYRLFQRNVVSYLEAIVPEHLSTYIEGFSSYYINRVLSMFIFDVCKHLIDQGVLECPSDEKAMVDGMCYIF